MRAAQMSGQWVTEDFCPGDVVIYDFPGGAATDHCGIVERVTESGVIAIEGNTGSGSDADGGQVQRRSRAWSVIVGAVRAKDLTEEVTKEMEERFNTVANCPSWATPTVESWWPWVTSPEAAAKWTTRAGLRTWISAGTCCGSW